MMSYENTFKILLLSYPEVDKTYVYSYIPQRDHRSAIGVDFISRTLDVDEKKYKLQLWDMVSDKRFTFLLPHYCLGANAVIIVYDVTRSQTLDNIMKEN